MAKGTFQDFLRNFAGMLDEVDNAGLLSTEDDGTWWELFDLDVEPKTAAVLDVAWKAWRFKNHPDRGVCSDTRFRHMSALYDRKRGGLLGASATG